jgi:hypothetical protein
LGWVFRRVYSETKSEKIRREKRRRLNQKLNVLFLVFHLGPERGGALSAEIFVLIPIRQDQEKAFAHRNGPAATGAEELARLKLVVSGLRTGG